MYMKQYSDPSDPNIKSVFKRFGNLTAQNLHSKDAIYHKNCYSNVANERNLRRAIERQKRTKKITTQHLFCQREGDQHHFHLVELGQKKVHRLQIPQNVYDLQLDLTILVCVSFAGKKVVFCIRQNQNQKDSKCLRWQKRLMTKAFLFV